MMWRLILPALAHVLFAAHCYFHGLYAFIVLPAMLLSGLLIRHRAIPWVQCVALLAFAAEWLRTTWVLVEMRRLYGMPYTTATIILVSVALFTAISAFMPLSRRLRQWYEAA